MAFRAFASLAFLGVTLVATTAVAQDPPEEEEGSTNRYGWPEAPPPPPEVDPEDKKEWRFDAFEGTHGFVGLGAKPGLGILFDHAQDQTSDPEFAFLFALRGGILFDRAELSMELAPVTARNFWPGRDPNLSMLVNYGYHLPLGGPVNWPIRIGAGVTAVNFLSDAAFQSRLDAVGLSIDYKHFLVDIQLPSLRHHTDFDGYSLLNLFFGVDAAYVF